MITFGECTRLTTCYDCDNEKCWHHGKKESDCPTYRCDQQGNGWLDCGHCAFIDRFIEDMREEYKKEVIPE